MLRANSRQAGGVENVNSVRVVNDLISDVIAISRKFWSGGRVLMGIGARVGFNNDILRLP